MTSQSAFAAILEETKVKSMVVAFWLRESGILVGLPSFRKSTSALLSSSAIVSEDVG